MDPLLIPTLAGIVVRVIESVQAGRKPDVTDEEMDFLRQVSQGKLDAFLKASEGK